MSKKFRIVGRWVLGPGGFRRPAISGGGGGDQPRVNGNPQQTVSNTGDPSLAELNRLMTEQIKSVLPSYGNLAGLLQPRSFNQLDYGNPTGPEHTALNSMRNFLAGPTTNDYMLAGLGQMQQAADPSRQLAAGQDYMARVLGPMTINQLTAAGQGRSGAVQEALANAAAGIALPILQNTQGLQSQFGGTLANFGQQQYNRQLQNLSALTGLAGAERMSEAGATNPGMDTLLSMIARFPVNSGAGTATSSQWIPSVSGGEPPIWQQVMGGMNSLLSLAGMVGMMACWVAAALWAEKDWPRFVCAFYQINFGKPSLLGRLGRKLYRRYGQSWANSRLACAVLRPFLNRAARAGARKLGVTLVG